MDDIKRTGPSIMDFLTDPNVEIWPTKKFSDLTREDHERVKELALYIGAKMKALAEELKVIRDKKKALAEAIRYEKKG